MKNLNATRHAVGVAKNLGGVPFVVSIIIGGIWGDTLTNTLTLTGVFSMKAGIILQEVKFVQQWMIILLCLPAAFIFSRQVVRGLVAMEIHTQKINSNAVNFGAVAVSFLLSFGGLADGMFNDITSFAGFLQPGPLMRLLVIIVVAAAPLSFIHIGVMVLRQLVSEKIASLNAKEVKAVEAEFYEIGEAESQSFKGKVLGRIKRRINSAAPMSSEEIGTRTFADIESELNLN